MGDIKVKKEITTRKQVVMSGKLHAILKEDDLRAGAMEHVPGDMTEGEFVFDFSLPSWMRDSGRLDIDEFLKEIEFRLTITKEDKE